MRVLYVDPSLERPLGHHANVTVNIVHALHALGHEVQVLGNGKASAGLGVDVERAFSKAVYSHLEVEPGAAFPALARYWAGRYESEVLPYIARFSPDLIYANSISGFVLAGLADAVGKLYPAGQCPPIVGEFPFPSSGTKEAEWYAAQIRYAIETMPEGVLARTTLMTVNGRTAARLGEAIEWPAAAFPSPYVVPASPDAQGRERAPGSPIRVGVLGHQAGHKGILLVPDILEIALAEVPGVEVVVQVQEQDTDPAVRARLHDLAKGNPRLEVISGALDKEEYDALARRLDVFLLPYDRKRYQSSISGICYEALSNGGCVVCPDDSSLADIVVKYQGDTGLFGEWTARSIADALKRVVDDFEAVSERAREGQRHFLEENGPVAFARELLAHAAPDAPRRPSVLRALRLSKIAYLKFRCARALARIMRRW